MQFCIELQQNKKAIVQFCTADTHTGGEYWFMDHTYLCKNDYSIENISQHCQMSMQKDSCSPLCNNLCHSVDAAAPPLRSLLARLLLLYCSDINFMMVMLTLSVGEL